jgi:hypothetical protein
VAGSGNISVNQTKQYGDQQLLDSMKAQTTTPMTGVPTPAPTAGRPAGSGGGTTPAPMAGQQADVAPEHMDMMQQFAMASRVKQFWDNIAAQYPSSWARMYAQDAEEQYQRLGHELRSKTPFFNV